MGFGGIHPFQLLIVLALGLLVFGGRGRISAMMGDMAQGIRSFRKGLKDDSGDSETKAERTEHADSAGGSDRAGEPDGENAREKKGE